MIVQRRIGMTASLLVAGLILSASLAPAPALAATNRYTEKGKGADGFWSNCLEPAANTNCTDVFLVASEFIANSNGETFESGGIFIEIFRYHFDRRGNFHFDSDTLGFGEATITVDNKLTSATASGTIPTEVCIERHRNFDCFAGDPLDVAGSWSGYGAVARFSDSFHFHTAGYSENGRFSGKSRSATASVTIDGFGLGDALGASIFEGSYRDFVVCHDC
jgi:hypothetical protein